MVSCDNQVCRLRFMLQDRNTWQSDSSWMPSPLKFLPPFVEIELARLIPPYPILAVYIDL